MFQSRFYKAAPPLAQECMIGLRAAGRGLLRENAAFRRMQAKYRASQYLDASGLADLQELELGRLLLHAAETVPFYRGQVSTVSIQRLRPREALELFPVIDKTVVRSNADGLVSSRIRRPIVSGTTSGTTGAPLRVVQDLRALTRENVFVHRQLEWAGFAPGCRRAWIRGDLVVDGGVRRPPFWRRNPIERMLMMSSFHLSTDSAPLYLAALTRHDPHVIQAYPSSIGFLAKYLRTSGQRFQGASLRSIITSSESLDDDARRTIEATFGCRVFDWYGQFERVAAAGTCEHDSTHLIADYSFVELPHVATGEYEVIGTGFNNYAMPLIRYRTGDTVRMGDPAPCPCGRHFPRLEKVVGRADDCIRTPDGRQVGRLDRVFNDAAGVVEGQIVQDDPRRLDIYVVPGAGFGSADEAALVGALLARVGSGMEISVKQVSALTRTRNGKVRSVVCSL